MKTALDLPRKAREHFALAMEQYAVIAYNLKDMRESNALTKSEKDTRTAVLKSRYFTRQIPRFVAYNIGGPPPRSSHNSGTQAKKNTSKKSANYSLRCTTKCANNLLQYLQPS